MNLLARLRTSAYRDLLTNAGSMIGTTAVTAGLGFVYWWLAARLFPPQVVGFSSALISAMNLLGGVGMLGLGTLLIGELPRQPDQRVALIGTALVVAAVVAAVLGGVFAVIAPFVSADLRALDGGVGDVLFFSGGVVLTAVTLVLDQALIGLLRGGLQLWRNSVFAVVKLVVLVVVGFWVRDVGGLVVYNTWTFGNFVSLVVLGFGLRVRPSAFYLRWELLRRLPGAALRHHVLNLALQLPGLVLPVIVTAMLSARLNASFYMAWLLLYMVFSIPYTLTIVLYAAGAADLVGFARKVRLTLQLAIALGVVSNIVVWVGAEVLLGFFGQTYAAEASWAFRIMGLGVFPLIVKDHFVAICRVRDRLSVAAAVALLGSFLELLLASFGAWSGGLNGLAIGFVVALCIEAVFGLRTVFTVVLIAPGEAPMSEGRFAGVDQG